MNYTFDEIRILKEYFNESIVLNDFLRNHPVGDDRFELVDRNHEYMGASKCISIYIEFLLKKAKANGREANDALRTLLHRIMFRQDLYKEEYSFVFEKKIEQVPLYINDQDKVRKNFVFWRLRIGK